MKVEIENICYQHHQATSILEKLLKKETNYQVRQQYINAIEWITDANDSAIRMENKLKENKENERTGS